MLEDASKQVRILHGIKTHDGDIITDPVWFSIADVIRGISAFGFKHAAEAGVLVILVDGEWKEPE